MRLPDNDQQYGLGSIVFHWLVAVFVNTQLSLGIYMDGLPEEAESYWTGIHIGIGATAFLFIAFRVIWRLMSTTPALLPQDRNLQRLARAVHHLLLLGISIMIISGPLMVWTAGYPISIFDVVVIPTPFDKMETVHEILEEVHVITAWTVLTLLCLHVSGALKHVFINRDNTLGRMLGKSGNP